MTVKEPIAGTFQFVARHSNKVLEVGSNSTSGDTLVQRTNVNEAHQCWNVRPVGRYWMITNSKTGLAMDVSGESLENGGLVIQYPYSRGDNQLWSHVDLGNGYFQIMNKNSQKVIDINSVSTADGARAIQYTPSEGHNQQFFLNPAVITSVDDPYTGVQKVKCFPNPFSQSFRISEGDFTYSISDATGAIMEERDCSKSCDLGEGLSPGVYLLHIHNSHISKYVKVIKQ